MTLRKTYEVRPGPPSMQWPEYERRLTVEWERLLSGNPAEGEIHSFIEKHPCLLPGAFSFPASGSYPVRAALITKPALQSTTRRVPDFMWLAADSATLYPVLIEIETPEKRWFTARGIPTQQFTQAVSQLREWRAWFNRQNNQSIFMQQFDIDADYDRGRFRPQFVLVYGKRAEFDDNRHLLAARASQEHPDESFMTFDRLKPLQSQDTFICIRRRPQWHECVAVPPILRMNPGLARHWLGIRGRAEAIRNCEWMSHERREFLASRINYWDQWARTVERGIINMGDDE